MSNPNKMGLVFAILLGGWHVVWSILVATGLGQTLYDFILWAHMIHLAVRIGPFDLTASITLIVVTAIFGYVIGYIGTLVWNRMHRSKFAPRSEAYRVVCTHGTTGPVRLYIALLEVPFLYRRMVMTS